MDVLHRGMYGRGVAAHAALVSLTLASFAVIHAVHAASESEVTWFVFFAVPVALLVVGYGLRGGLVGAGIAITLTFIWFEGEGHALLSAGFVSRGTAFLVVGAATGWALDQSRSAIRALERRDARSSDLISSLSLGGVFASVNQAWTNQLGYRADHLIGKPVASFVHADDRAATEAAFSNLAVEPIHALLHRFAGEDGSFQWLEWEAQLDPESRTINGLARNVTVRENLRELEQEESRELAQAVEELREVNQRLYVVAETVADALITVDRSGIIQRFNPSSERMFGVSRDGVIGTHVDAFIADATREPILRSLNVDDESPGGETILRSPIHEVEARRHNGASFPAELSIGAVSQQGEEFFILTLRDITERKRQEETDGQFKKSLQQAVLERTTELQALAREVDSERREVIERLALVGEFRDDLTAEHTARVGHASQKLAELVGMTRQEAERMRLAASLHDIGKVGVPDTILLKPGTLTESERLDMEKHTRVGADILSSQTSPVLKLAGEIALSHHEWWDGSGYPNRLAGSSIPLSGRIVALADTFDALTHDRPYKKAWSVSQALLEIERLDGQQFDPDVVKAFGTLDPYEVAGVARVGPPLAH